MINSIGDIAENVPCLPPHTKCQKVDRIFSDNPSLQGLVVINDHRHPIGLITRTGFYQKMGTLYGYNLYMGRSIHLLLNNKPLIVDYSKSIITVSEMAMNRQEEHLYDEVIVTENGKFFGVVSIRNLLIRFAEIQTEIAIFMNPLTGLPGNNMIEEQIKKVIHYEQYSILYIDLDHFKTFNDTYGFKKGDVLLQKTAEILKNNIVQQGSFVGHIGGDDFISIINHHQYKPICQHIINDFDHAIRDFYSKSHFEQKYVISKNRAGELEKIPLVSISIAVITNEGKNFETIEDISNEASKLKKLCKCENQSCFYVNA